MSFTSNGNWPGRCRFSSEMRYWDTQDVTVMRTRPFDGAMSASLYSVSDPFASSYSSTMASMRRLSSSPAGVSDIRLFW